MVILTVKPKPRGFAKVKLTVIGKVRRLDLPMEKPKLTAIGKDWRWEKPKERLMVKETEKCLVRLTD